MGARILLVPDDIGRAPKPSHDRAIETAMGRSTACPLEPEMSTKE